MAQQQLASLLEQDVRALAQTIGERHLGKPHELATARDFIETRLASAGFKPARQSYHVDGQVCDNLEVQLLGSTHPGQIVVVGAHYDSAMGSPGANDNASGVAALLALAQHFVGRQPGKTLRLVAFVNEEPPAFQQEVMGSVVYARRCRELNEDIVAMLAMDGIGYYSEAEGSQQYPFPFNVFYPSRGDFVGFVGNTRSSALVRQIVKVFREKAQFPSEGAAIPGVVPGAGWSDHWSFWQQGYPGVMITDTLPFRYRHYHQPTDTPEHLDYERMARVVDGLKHVVADLVDLQP